MSTFFPFHPQRASNKATELPAQYLPDTPTGYTGSMNIGQNTFYTPFQPMLFAQPMAFPFYASGRELHSANYNHHYQPHKVDDSLPEGWAKWEARFKELEEMPMPVYDPHRHRTVSQAVPGPGPSTRARTLSHSTHAWAQEDIHSRALLASEPVPEWVRNGKGPIPKGGLRPSNRPPSRKSLESDRRRQENHHPTNTETSGRNRTLSSSAHHAHSPAPDQGSKKAHKLLQYGSKKLIRYDMRLPYTSVKKTIDTGHPTYLKYSDLTSAAFEPFVKEAFICTSAIRDLAFKVVAKNGECVLVQDVLDAIQRCLCGKIDVERYMRDSINTNVYKDTIAAFEKRIELYAGRVEPNRVRHGGLQNVDQLGKKYMFVGLTPLFNNVDGKDWWMLHVDIEDESTRPSLKPASRIKRLFSKS